MKIELPSGTLAELAHPKNGPAQRGMVIIPDIMGMRPLFVDLVDALAQKYQWSVCAFELYPGREHLEVADRLAAGNLLTDQRVLGDAVAAAEATGADPVGVMGFCMGGMYALKAVATKRFDRHCPFYGMIQVPEQWKNDDSLEPLAALDQGNAASVLAIVGSLDSWTPEDQVKLLAATGAQVVRYPEADHGFVHDASRPAHRSVDAADAWHRVAQWMEVSD
ncbi:MAG: dienelactone hydrolase family protein [Acidimicrobiales bacterium]|nr:dienelactone hydrolase family protein [Acidimicrobiales bacterium]